MRLHELADKDQQLDELNVGKAVGAVGRGIGKAVGGVAKGIGAVAGGIAGIPGAVKKGFQAGKATVAGTDTVQPQAAGSASGQQAQAGQKPPAAGSAAQPSAQGTAKTTQSQTGSSQSAAPAATGGSVGSGFAKGFSAATGQSQNPAADDSDDQQAAPEPAASQPTAAQTQSDQAQEKPEEQPPAAPANVLSALQDRIMKLDTASRQEILKAVTSAYLSKVPNLGDKTGQKPAAGSAAAQAQTDKQPTDQSADDQGKRGVEQPGKPTFTGVPEKPAPDADQSADQGGSKLAPGAFGKMAQDLTKPLAGADSATPGAAIPQSGGRKQGGGKVAGQLSTDPRAVKRREQRAAKKTAGKAPSQAEIDADRERIMGPTSDSIIRKRPAIVERFSLFRK